VNVYPFIEAEKAQQRNVKRACERADLPQVAAQPEGLNQVGGPSVPLGTGRSCRAHHAIRTARVGHEVAVSVLGVSWFRPASCCWAIWCMRSNSSRNSVSCASL
jgi:hypothetical protein